MLLEDFDRAPAPDAAAVARVWADVPSWVDALVASRPHGSLDALLARAAEEAAAWGERELDAALAHHPRIGDRPTGDSAEAAASRREQAAMADADAEVAARMAEGNAAYEARFGRVFLIRAAGRSPVEMLGELDRRRANDDAAEVREACGQLLEIALARIRAAFAAPSETAPSAAAPSEETR
ncbi:2-oxo-4-hydroxy-4-carboxy-5-ureidoimidazoline decarboxylase [Microbacterium sp. JZ37]|uniref:2-oxo-4-hydroxy-4-carboxy-5-ureidoimidazoline decarboxylase n=1 Tax=Microbacterium sp. JZ37 TaxID=2654193 RepID=UPI002B4A4FF6|nr:2-oxo-4-hydroxy-4-carboxy-5-ureidoimidazoline decarboxylase [Microbacterium sp. JZ37]WRH18647.1 2-oxo-4-hydroxy-4-carboxy-5-ureidoimidazoline decarboxylase [Microbacterium sp. JZ37]